MKVRKKLDKAPTQEPLDFVEMFQKQFKATEKTWKHDRGKVMGSSEVFGCLRKSYFSKNDYPQDEDYSAPGGAARRGDILENQWIAPAVGNWLPKGAELLFAGEEQETLIDGYLSATPDGLIVGLERNALQKYGVDDILSDCVITEFKTFDSRANINGPKDIHYGQVQSQFEMFHKATDYRPEYAVIIYVNASFIDDVRPYIIKRDPNAGTVAQDRAKKVFEAKGPEELPAEGKFNDYCKFCPFTEQCSLVTLGTVPTKKLSHLSPDSTNKLEALLEKERGLKAKKDEYEKAHKVAAEEVKQFLRDEGTRWANTGTYSVSYSTQAGRKTLDKDLLMVELGIEDLEPFMKEGQGFEKLTIKVNDK